MENTVLWFNRIWLWVVVPTLLFATLIGGLLWGETKKAMKG